MFAALASDSWSSTWSLLSDGVAILIIAVLLLLGAFLGYALRGLVGRWRAEAIERQMRIREEESESEIKAKLKEADIAARAAVVKAKEEFDMAAKKRRAELQAVEDRLSQRENTLDRRAEQLDEKVAALEEKQAAVAVAEQKAKADAVAADKRLKDLAKMTHEEARREILTRANAELRADAAILSRRIQEAAREQGETIARRLVADAIQRCAVEHLVGRDGRNVRAFEAATGVTLLLDDAPDTVVLSAFDPQRREIARRALTELIADGRIHPASIESAVEAARASVESSNEEAGTAAAAEAGVPGLSADVLRLMGALAFRTSFTQNVLRHSVEVALLMGTMAAEMGLDAARARRIGFLHDIGKALTSEKKGAHAALGAEFLKAHGESEEICAAVAAHHADPGTDGGVYGTLCSAADAISSARPGARQESLGDYVQRLEAIEKLARSHKGVMNVYAVQAGRDLRVIVDPAEVPDQDMSALAGDICREISAQVKFPGLIRVTVIRERRCVEYAK